MKSISALLFCFAFILYSESLCQSLDFYKRITLSNFADKFAVDNFGNIIVINSFKNEISKYDQTGKLLKTIGGAGWSNGLFDMPTSVYTSPLFILITDYNNNRIQKFDKNLEYLSKFETSNLDRMDGLFESPVSVDISTLGDMYILDQRNKKIIKVTGFSNIERIFGGFSSGNIFFEDPVKLQVTEEQLIYVLDKNSIKVFDQFTNSIKQLNFTLESIQDFFIENKKLYILSSNQLYELTGNELIKYIIPETDEELKQIIKKGNLFYFLKDREITVLEEKERK